MTAQWSILSFPKACFTSWNHPNPSFLALKSPNPLLSTWGPIYIPFSSPFSKIDLRGDGHPRKKHLFFVSWTGVLKIQPENPESWVLQKTPLGTSFIPPHTLHRQGSAIWHITVAAGRAGRRNKIRMATLTTSVLPCAQSKIERKIKCIKNC